MDAVTLAAANAAAAKRYVPAIGVGTVSQWNLSSDATTRQIAAQPNSTFGPIATLGAQDIVVDPGARQQEILGFGAALTDASSYNLQTKLTQTQRTALLKELFDPAQGGLSFLRLPMGSSDFSATRYTYDDQPTGVIDPTLSGFSVSPDTAHRMATLREIFAINPRIRLLLTPWSPPAWMKVDPTQGLAPGAAGTTTANALAKDYFPTLAQYFVNTITAYAAYGFNVWAVTPQNEPLGQARLWPCMYMTAADQATFIGSYLGPALDAANLNTKIICFDHNYDNTVYPAAVMADATAGPYVEGVAWHWYVPAHPEPGMTTIARQFPTKKQFFTEACDSNAKAGTVANYFRDIFIGAMRSGCSAAMLWNIALDELGQPMNRGDNLVLHGLVTTPSNGSGAITRTADYWSLLQNSRFVKPGAYRVASTSNPSGLMSAAYTNPDGSVVAVIYNTTGSSQSTQIIDARTNQGVPLTLPAGEVATLRWIGAPVGAAAPSIAVPAAPTVAATGTSGRVKLTITAGSAGGSPIAALTVTRGTVSGARSLVATLPPGTTAWTDSGVTAATTYFYAVQAVNAGGAGPASTEVSATPTAATAPAAPTGLAATPGAGQIKLTFTASDNGGSAITSYQFYRSTTTGTEGATAIGSVVPVSGAPTVTWVDRAAANGTTYFYKVAAVNTVGTGAQSTEVSATPAFVETRAATKPATTAQPVLWLRTDVLMGATGGAVTAWPDITTNAYNAVLPSGAAGPVLTTGAVNGLPSLALRSNGSHRLVSPVPVTGENETIFLVFRPTAVSQAIVCGATSDAHVNNTANIYSDLNLLPHMQATGVGAPNNAPGTAMSATTFSVVASSIDTAANSHVLKCVVNGGTVGTVTPTTYTTATAAGLAIGGVAADMTVSADICEVIVFASCLSAADRSAWTVYLGQVYGVTVGAN